MAYAQTQFTNTNALYSGNIEIDANVEAFNPGGVISFLLYSTAGGGTTASPNGYLFKFDSANTHFAGRIFKVAAGVATEIGSNPTGVVANAAQLTGAHAIKCQYNKTGKMHMIVDGITVVTANDTTYAPNNTVGYGEEGGAGYVSAISIAGHSNLAVLDQDPNMRAYVDLSQAGHPNKQVDSLTDNTYARPLATRISSGKPLIDFSEAIHLNKHLGNVPDDTTAGGRRAHAVGTFAARPAAGTAGAHALYHAHDQGINGTTYRVNAGATAWVQVGAGTVDDIDDTVSTSYKKTIASRVSSGKPLIDFSEGIHLNKHLGNVPDDTSAGGRRAHAVGTLAARPAAGTAGAHALYHAHDQGINGTTYRVNAGATAWLQVGAGTIDDIDDSLSTVAKKVKATALVSGIPKKDVLHMFPTAVMDTDGIRMDVTNLVG